ncbi:MAG: glutamate 5-kinase [Dehalococcoidia bacterium]
MRPRGSGDNALPYRRIVVKAGTNLLTAGTDRIDGGTLAGLAAQLAELRARGCELILVTSGAIHAGRERLRSLPGGGGLASRQALAAVGQSRLMSLWDEVFEAHGIPVAQALLTRRDLADRLGYLNARNTLLTLLDLRVIPVVNENDVVAVDEISDSVIGDNDNLSALVANLVDADLLLLLSDVDGLYDADPATHPDARVIPLVEAVDAGIEAAAGAAGSLGTGGMVTKLQAARVATSSGTHVLLAHGLEPDIVLRAAGGEAVGTHFLPRGDRVESRRRFLLSGLPVRGRILVDGGAARAISTGGSSLLPAGIVAVDGAFERGDVIQVVDADGRHIASGTANYSAVDVERIRGQRSDRIATALGYEFGDEVVHRNNLVLV